TRRRSAAPRAAGGSCARTRRRPEPPPAASSPPSSAPRGRRRSRTSRGRSRRPCPSRSSAGRSESSSPRRARAWRRRPWSSSSVVLVVAAHPAEVVVARTAWRPVEELVEGEPPASEVGPVRRVGVVDDAVLEREGAQAGPLPRHVALEVGAAHEVVDEELRAAVEELGQRLRPLVGVEAVLLVEPHPRQLSPFLRELVVALRELLLALAELLPGGQPLLARPRRVLGHRSLLFSPYDRPRPRNSSIRCPRARHVTRHEARIR